MTVLLGYIKSSVIDMWLIYDFRKHGFHFMTWIFRNNNYNFINLMCFVTRMNAVATFLQFTIVTDYLSVMDQIFNR